MASAAAGRRTASAFPTFVRTHGYDSADLQLRAAPATRPLSRRRPITTVPIAYNGQPRVRLHAPYRQQQLQRHVRAAPGAWHGPSTSSPAPCPTRHRPTKCWPPSPCSGTTASTSGPSCGCGCMPPPNRKRVNNATGAGPPPTGPFVSLRVVGMEAAADEFQAGTTALYDVYTTPAFARSVLPRTTTGFLYLVQPAPRGRRRRRTSRPTPSHSRTSPHLH